MVVAARRRRSPRRRLAEAREHADRRADQHLVERLPSRSITTPWPEISPPLGGSPRW
jgi:hypothetical protein